MAFLSFNNKLLILFLLVGSLLIGVVLKLTWISRPLADGHEWNTAHTAITLENWKQHGMVSHRFVPMLGYSEVGDQGVPIEALRTPADSEGLFYYISFPPLAFVMPYVFFRVTTFEPELAIRIFNVALGIVAAVAAALGGTVLAKQMGLRSPALAGAVAFVLATLTPAFLWMFSNNYFVQSLSSILNLLIATIAFRLWSSPRGTPASLLCLGIIVQYLAALTDWFTIAWLAGWVLGAFVVRDRRYWLYLGGLTAAIIAGFLTTFFLYSSQVTGGAVSGQAGNRIASYSIIAALTSGKDSFQVPFYLVSHLMDPYVCLTLALCLGIVVLLLIRTSRPQAVSPWVAWVAMSSIGPLLVNVALLGFTVHHDFSVLPLALVLVPAAAVPIVLFAEVASNGENRAIASILVCLSLLFVLVIPTMHWLDRHRPWQRDFRYETLGEYVSSKTPVESIAVLKTKDVIVQPAIIYYAKRNVITEEGYKLRCQQNPGLRERPFVVSDDADVAIPSSR